MESERFNQICRQLRREQNVSVFLINGTVIQGQPLHHFEATTLAGSIEINTARGIVRLLSSAIDKIEPLDDMQV